MIFGRKAHALLSAESSATHRAIALFAGASAMQTALAHDLVDELRIIEYPILLGDGNPLFARDQRCRELPLTDSRRDDSGATVQRFRFK